MGKRAQRIPSWPGVIHSNKGRIHLRRPTRDIVTLRLRQSGGPYIPDCSSYVQKSGKLADLADALPLQILPPNLSVDHDFLVLEQHHDVGAAEEKEAEFVALLQPGTNLGRQVDRGNVAQPDRQYGHEPHLR